MSQLRPSFPIGFGGIWGSILNFRIGFLSSIGGRLPYPCLPTPFPILRCDERRISHRCHPAPGWRSEIPQMPTSQIAMKLCDWTLDSENSRRLWLFPDLFGGSGGKFRENRWKICPKSRNALISRAWARRKGKPAANLRSTLPGTLSTSSVRDVFFAIDSYSLLEFL